MSKSFDKLRSENKVIVEDKEARGAIRTELNKLSSLWWDNYEKQGQSGWFANGKGLIPLTNFGIDAPRKGGIMVMGVNGGVSQQEIAWWKDRLDEYDAGDDDLKAEMRSMYEGLYKDGKKRTLQGVDTKSQGFGGVFGGPEKQSTMRGTEWAMLSIPNRPANTSKQGRFLFQANFNRLLEVWGEQDLIKKCGNTNLVPWGSPTVKHLKDEHYKLAQPAATAIIKFFQPKLIAMPLGNLKHVKKMGYKLKSWGSEKRELISAKGTAKNYKIFEVYKMEGPGVSTVIWGMPHWSGLGGAIQIKAWKESVELRDTCKNIIRELVGKDFFTQK